MNNKLIFVFTCSLLTISLLFAQSDYEIVQNFKERSGKIEQAINNADSLSALSEILVSIDQLKSDFIAYKELLDNGLYPDNFNNTIEKLRNSCTVRKNDFTQIEILQTEVGGLRKEVDTLNRRNSELINQFQVLEAQSRDATTRIAQLEKTIAQMKESLLKRDQVIMNIVDGLLPEGNNLSMKEKQEVYKEAEKNNILLHIKRAVIDNIRFLEVTKLYPDDIKDIKDKQNNFARIWKNAGPTMVELYSEKGKSTNELKEIDYAFTRWHEKLDEEAWDTIYDEFAERDIKLKRFSTGKEFSSALTDYIDAEMKNIPAKGENEAENIYRKFADTTWYGEIKDKWVPFLRENKLLTEEEEDSIEVKIASWRDTVYPAGMNWLYIVVGVLVVAIVAFFFVRKSPKQTVGRNTSGEQTG